MPPLVPCPSCQRHLRIDHTACPFCAATLPDDLAKKVVPAARSRLDRFATITFATALSVAAAAACGGSTETTPDGTQGTPPPGTDAGRLDKDSGGAVPAYGLPDPRDAGADANVFDGNIAPAYGLPIDASFGDSSSTDGSSSLDGAATDADTDAANVKDSGGIGQLYGMPPGN